MASLLSVEAHVEDAFSAAPGKVCAYQDERRQTNGLEKETRDHDVDADAFGRVGVGRVRYGATDRLQKEGEEVGGHESDSDCTRLEAGTIFAVDDDDACQAKVDCRGKEDRGDGEGDEVAEGEVVRGRISNLTECNDLHQEPI